MKTTFKASKSKTKKRPKRIYFITAKHQFWEIYRHHLREAVDNQTAKRSATKVFGKQSMVCATSGQTLSGAGTLQAYIYDRALAVWARYVAGDLSVTATSIGKSSDVNEVFTKGRMNHE